MRKLSKLGFSLIEMMVVVGVMSIVMLAAGQFIMANMHATRSIELTSELDQMMLELQLTLKNPAVCAANLPNLASNPLDPTAPARIALSKIDSLTSTILTNGGTLRNQSGSTVNIYLENFQNISPTEYTADLAVELDKGQVNIIGGKLIKRHILLDLTTANPAPAVTVSACYAMANSSSSPTAVCSLLGGTYNATSGLCDNITVSGPSTSPSSICAMFGGVYNYSTGLCDGGGGSAGGGPGGSPTPLPAGMCPAQVVACSKGINITLPAQGTGGGMVSGPFTGTDGNTYHCTAAGRCVGTWMEVMCACH